ncbi:UAP56-interacting factor [Biomphalaria pfeifferi]|uniref:UAP56-interacting factor n=1 Tax=Biomphalaria pfeifferi TaxID=112525 RepID=A0AAD8FKE5_BIOPF|nr:UAP56-interacting factor [Biomphalaria pfeifferi]
MSLQPQDKVNMSLDEIIKISKSEKRKQAVQIKKGLVFSRGQGVKRGQGRGRGGNQTNVNSKQLQQTPVSPVRGRGRGGRGRGRGVFQQRDKSINPLDRINTNKFTANTFKTRGRGRNTNVQPYKRGQANTRPNSGFRDHQSEAAKQAALLREKQLALKNLQLAKQNVQNVNLALQKSSRDLVVNQKRGLNNITTSNRGRGRGRLLTQPIRQLNNTSVTVINPSALTANASIRGRRKRWRGSLNKQRSEHFTIQVANENLQQVQQEQGSIVDQLKLLKPTVPTAYKFQKNMFATPATGLSLNERFSSTAIAESGDAFSPEGRKVFL